MKPEEEFDKICGNCLLSGFYTQHCLMQRTWLAEFAVGSDKWFCKYVGKEITRETEACDQFK